MYYGGGVRFEGSWKEDKEENPIPLSIRSMSKAGITTTKDKKEKKVVGEGGQPAEIPADDAVVTPSA